MTFYGMDTTTLVDVENGQATASALTHATPSVTTTVSNTLLVTAHSFTSCATWTPPSGMTEAVDVASDAVPATVGISLEMSYATQASAGATGAKTATASNDTDSGVAQILALRQTLTAPIGFNYLDTPVDLTPVTTGSYVDVDASAYIPSGATGVILQVHNPSGSDYAYGARKNGSTDTWMDSSSWTGYRTSWSFLMVGVDSNRIFEVYTENTAVKTYLVGYTGQGVTFFTNAVSKATATTAGWVDVDISSDTGAETALAAIFIMKETSGTAASFGLRKKGSTDEFYYDMHKGGAEAYIVGLDANEVAQQKIENAALDLYLQGYVTGGAVLFTNATDKSTGTKDSYQDVDITADIGSNDANGAIVDTFVTDNSAREVAVRKNGATYDYYDRAGHVSALVAIDENDIFEQKVSDVKRDLYLLGYTLDPGCDGTFQYRMPITVQANQVSSGPHTNFPVLFNTTSTNLKSISNGGKVWNSNGHDIIFRGTDDTTCGGYLRSPCTLDHEIEKYDHTTGELVAWVRVPSIANGTVIYVYYGNCAVNSSTQHASAVWDSNFKAVWHLKESGNGTVDEYDDSTSNANDGQGGGGTAGSVPTLTSSGKVNGAQEFDGTADYVKVPNDASLNITGAITISAWVYSPISVGAPGRNL